jgi:HAD superfamily hydrolase (TIGR01490 family)
MIAAIFDLDGTLYTGHVARGIAAHHRAHRVKRALYYTYLLTHLPVWLLWRLGIVSETQSRKLWTRDMGWTVRGWTPEEASRAFAWIAQEYVHPLVRSDVLARLREHQAMDHRTILVSGTPTPLLKEIGAHLGIEETVGTPLRLRAGRYTGGSEPPVCQGRGKVIRLDLHLGHDHEVNWEQSYAYADSYTDLPLLERVGHPVAVYPDEPLAEHAHHQGWQTMA